MERLFALPQSVEKLVSFERGQQSFMNVGDRIRVTTSVIVYNHPQHQREAFDLNGMEGVIEAIIGRPITATLPIKVRFEPKYVAHLREDEIEVI